MKARIKATGELIDLPRLTRVYSYKEDESMFFLKDLEILDNIQPDYWTRLEHQYAGMAMNALLSTNNIRNGDLEGMRECNINAMAIAHALVEKMKENEKAMH